jgi:glycerol uptake facilitator-like aquaporin
VEILENIINKYLAYPIVIDSGLSCGIWFTSKYLEIFTFVLTDKSNQLSILPNIISADVSLAGFILAALTIIVTFRSNIQSKGMNDATNALELIFSSKHYLKIVQVFKKSIIELVICFIFLFCTWISTDNFSIGTIYRINIIGITISTLAISRSLFILFIVLELEKHKRIDE